MRLPLTTGKNGLMTRLNTLKDGAFFMSLGNEDLETRSKNFSNEYALHENGRGTLL